MVLKLLQVTGCLNLSSRVSRLLQLLQDYTSAIARIPPLLQPLMQPFISRVEASLLPGLTTLSWTSLNTNECQH